MYANPQSWQVVVHLPLCAAEWHCSFHCGQMGPAVKWNEHSEFGRKRFLLIITGQGFPGGAVVENPPASAGDTGSSPGLGRSHMPRSSWAREPQLTEPARLEPVLRNKRGRDSERPAHRDEEWPPLAATRESPRTETKTQHSHKEINKQILKKK